MAQSPTSAIRLPAEPRFHLVVCGAAGGVGGSSANQRQAAIDSSCNYCCHGDRASDGRQGASRVQTTSCWCCCRYHYYFCCSECDTTSIISTGEAASTQASAKAGGQRRGGGGSQQGARQVCVRNCPGTAGLMAGYQGDTNKFHSCSYVYTKYTRTCSFKSFRTRIVLLYVSYMV